MTVLGILGSCECMEKYSTGIFNFSWDSHAVNNDFIYTVIAPV